MALVVRLSTFLFAADSVAAVDCIADGTVIILEDGPVAADGYEWWRPEGRSGWVAGDWLRYVDENATPSPASATPTPTG